VRSYSRKLFSREFFATFTDPVRFFTISETGTESSGHVLIYDQRLPKQALQWVVPGFERGPGKPRANWNSLVVRDLQKVHGISWEETDESVSACRQIIYTGDEI